MPRKSKVEFEPSPQCEAALTRITALAHRLAAMLVGETLSPDGLAEGPRSTPLVMAMIYFLLRVPPQDLEAAFLATGSFRDIAFRPYPAGSVKAAPLAQFFPA